MKKNLIPALFCLALASCNQTPSAAVSESKTDSAAVAQNTTPTAPTTPSTEGEDTYVPLWKRLNESSEKYTFKDTEAYDRCSSLMMSDKSGKKVDLPKAIQGELDCIGSAFMFFADRYIVFSEENVVKIYDLDTKKIGILFSNFNGIQSNLTDVSADHSKLLFVNVFYDDAQRKKSDYTQETRIMVVDFDPETLMVKAKKKFDRKVRYFNAEGDMVDKNDCKFVSNTAFKYREYEADADGMPKNDAKMTEVAF
jgi:hypothetical protein